MADGLYELGIHLRGKVQPALQIFDTDMSKFEVNALAGMPP